MRELSLEEQELIAGGTDTGIIVDPLPDPGDNGGDWGDWGDWGEGDGVPGDSGGTTASTTTTDDDGQPVVIESRFDGSARSVDVVAQVKDAAGLVEFVWNMPAVDVGSFTLTIRDAAGSHSGSVALGNGMGAGTHAVTFSNGATGSLTFADAGGGSVSAGIRVSF